MREIVKEVKQALDWAIAEVEGRTKYSNPFQLTECIERAKKASEAIATLQPSSAEREEAARMLEDYAIMAAREGKADLATDFNTFAGLLRTPVAVEWHGMDKIPQTPTGTVRNFAVAFRSKERGSIWVEEAYYLNAFPLTPRDDNADEIEGADEDGCVPFSGWHERFGDEDEPFYQGIQMDSPYTEVLGWAEMPVHPLAAGRK